MPTPEITRSELIRALVDLGTLVTSPQPLDVRMNGLCEMATAMLKCSHVTVMQRSGARYRGMWQYGLDADQAKNFKLYDFPLAEANQARIEACDTYLLFNDPRKDSIIATASEALDIQSIVIVPFTHPDGAPLGYLAATYTEHLRDISHDEAELAFGLARILQTALLRQIETQRRRQLSQAVLHVADSERRRLSRDIHDDPLQRLLAIRIGLEAFRETAADPSAIDDFIEECRAASTSLREVMLRTHPTSSDLADLEETVNVMVDNKDVDNDIVFSFVDTRAVKTPGYLIPALNRIGEQAARNALRHAEASQLMISLRNHDNGTLLNVDDDGKGFDPSAVSTRRLGLVSMRERTELLGGIFSIESTIGSGTKISAWLPHRENIT